MKTINQSIIRLKECMVKGMIANFKTDGELVPVLFFLEENQPFVTQLPNEYVTSTDGMATLIDLINKMCKKPSISAVGFLYMASLVCMQKESLSELLIRTGTLSVTDLKTKQDVIILHFATPEYQEEFIFPVDTKNKTVGERYATADNGTELLFGQLFVKAA